jgi:hypothetical protein
MQIAAVVNKESVRMQFDANIAAAFKTGVVIWD